MMGENVASTIQGDGGPERAKGVHCGTRPVPRPGSRTNPSGRKCGRSRSTRHPKTGSHSLPLRWVSFPH
eukprot:scaffold1728_cov116-Isochrysis_galbana.AAC.7